MFRRLVRWLLGVPHPDDLDEHVRNARRRDRQRTDAIHESDRSNIGGSPGGGVSGSSSGFGG